MMNTRCGSVAIIGEPNAGKSTLTNLLVGSKVSIVSPKVQTTRVRTLGIAIWKESQVILLDTPGIFSAQKSLEKALVKQAWRSVDESDALVLLVDTTKQDQTLTQNIIEKLPVKKPLFICFNKVDLNPNFKNTFVINRPVDGFFPISAKTNEGVNTFMEKLCAFLPYHPWHYPEDIITDQPEALWAAEITREQLYLQLHQELPYETYIEPEGYERFDNGDIKISQAIVVARDAQKGIVLGAKGARIKSLGLKARKALEKELGCTVHLKIFVKVKCKWMENESIKRELGL
ncbi:MAG: GTPase Era [Holosporales bacterium]